MHQSQELLNKPFMSRCSNYSQDSQ